MFLPKTSGLQILKRNTVCGPSAPARGEVGRTVESTKSNNLLASIFRLEGTKGAILTLRLIIETMIGKGKDLTVAEKAFEETGIKCVTYQRR